MAGKAATLIAAARRLFRSDREILLVAEADLQTWARSHNLNLRQAVAAALEAGIFPECFERNFPSLSAAEQLRLFESAALVVGLGGLGGTLAVLLARVGVGRLLLADGDVFQPSNLNRQLLATQATLGRNKAQVAAEHLLGINPALEVKAIPRFLDRETLPDCLSQVQVALDGLDSLKARQDLFGAAQQAGVPLVHGAVRGQYGQVATILPADRESFARIFVAASDKGEPPDILAPLPTLIASLQVQEAVRLLLGKTPAYHGCLAHFDGDTGRLEMLPLG
jgi:molybdopterin/thiamine biosynthesis adenylyltransferase